MLRYASLLGFIGPQHYRERVAIKISHSMRIQRMALDIEVLDMALSLGLTPQEYCRLENGEGDIDLWGTVLANIAIELGESPEGLVPKPGELPSAQSIGERVKTIRSRLGISVERLADRIGIAQQELVALEAGRSPIEQRGAWLVQFAMRLDIPVMQVICPSQPSDFDDARLMRKLRHRIFARREGQDSGRSTGSWQQSL